MSSVVVSAPGKVILHGEHSVVYGKTALATSVDLRCYLVLIQTTDSKVTLHLPDLVPDLDLRKEWNVGDIVRVSDLRRQSDCTDHAKVELLKELGDLKEKKPAILELAVHVFLYLLMEIYEERLKDVTGLSASVFSRLPAGAGLGSSAAYSVCLAAGFLCDCGKLQALSSSAKDHGDIPKEVEDKMMEAGIELDNKCDISKEGWCMEEYEMINHWGFEAEKVVHGTPSGIDNSISTYGGAISYQSSVSVPLKAIPSVRILIVNTNVPRSTMKMVAAVRERYKKFPSVVIPILESVDAISTTARSLYEELSDNTCSLQRKNTRSQLEELFLLNQHLLDALGVGHPAITQVCSLAKSVGLSAKLTGGGGGGCVIALIPPDMTVEKVSEVQATFRNAGFESWETVIGCHGVQVHQTDASQLA